MIKRIYFSLIALSMLLYSCSSKDDKTAGEENTARKSKIFRYNQAEGLTSLDPIRAKNQANIWAVSQIYNGLFVFTEDLSETPLIADTWKITKGGTVYTIKLKKDVVFQNDPCFPDGIGREVLAKDFVYSFKRVLKDPASTGAWIFSDKVLRDKSGNISDTAFVAVDDYTLRIYLNEPFPPFLQILAMPYAFVVPEEAIKKYGKDFSRHPVGSGPFVLKDWDEGNSLTLIKNKNYWRKDHSHNTLPYLDAIQVSFIPDKNQEFLTFKQGNLDMISADDPSIIEQILKINGSVREEISQQFQYKKIPYLSTEYLGFQVDPAKYTDKKHPFLDKRVRQALSYAIDRDELVSFLRNNLGTPAVNGFVPKALPSFDEGKVKGYGYDPEKATQLLKEAGYPDGKGFPQVTFHTSNVQKVLAEHLQRKWDNVLGIKIELDVSNFAALQEKIESGDALFFRAAWIGDYPDEENFLSCFYGRNWTPAGPNKTHFKNEEFDNIYRGVHREPDDWKRHEIYHKLDQIVMNESPVIVLYYDEVLRLYQKDITGLAPNAMHSLSLEEVDFTDTGGEGENMASK